MIRHVSVHVCIPVVPRGHQLERGHFCSAHISTFLQLLQMLLFAFPIVLFASPISVFACEGDCIIGITQAWLGNYTSSIDTMFQHIVRLPGYRPHTSADTS